MIYLSAGKQPEIRDNFSLLLAEPRNWGDAEQVKDDADFHKAIQALSTFYDFPLVWTFFQPFPTHLLA